MAKAELKDLIVLVIINIIALSLAPTIATSVATAVADTNVTGASDTILGLITMLYIVCIIGANIAVLYVMFKD